MLLQCFLTRLPILPRPPRQSPRWPPRTVRVDVREDVRTHLPGEKAPMWVKRVSPTARERAAGHNWGVPILGKASVADGPRGALADVVMGRFTKIGSYYSGRRTLADVVMGRFTKIGSYSLPSRNTVM